MLGQLAAPKNLCVLHLSGIGGVCNAVAAIQYIQNQWPHTQITWVCGKEAADLLKGLTKIEIISFDQSAGLRGYSDLRAHMKGQSFNILLNMQATLQTNLVSYFIPAKIKIGFDRKRAKAGQWIFTNYKTQPQPEAHLMDDFMGFAQTLGLTASEPVWDIPIPESDEQWAYQTLFSANQKPIAVINLAANKAKYNWHVEGYAQTADYLDLLGFHVVLCGGSSSLEIQLAEYICQQSEVSILNLVAKTSLKQLLAVLKLGHITITPDAGAAHMSVTVGTPVVGLYAYNNPRKVGPYLYQKYVVSCYDEVIEEQKGKPHNQLPWGVQAKGIDLMDRITVEQVKSKINLVVEDYYSKFKTECKA